MKNMNADQIKCAFTTLLLGITMGACISTVFSPFTTSLLNHPRLALYICALCIAHFLEYACTLYNHGTMGTNWHSFLLDNSHLYNSFIVLSVGEYWCRQKYAWMGLFSDQQICCNAIRKITLFVLVCGGQALRTWSMLHASKQFTHTLAQKPAKLHKSGPYALCRHPSYFGYLLWMVGVQMLLESWICGFVGACVLVVFFRERVEEEEQMLLQCFGDDYLGYAKKVPSGILFYKNKPKI